MERNYNTNYKLYVNNTLEATLAETDGALTPPTPNIGRHTSGTTSSDFTIFEFIYWSAPLSSGNRGTVYTNQQTFYGF